MADSLTQPLNRSIKDSVDPGSIHQGMDPSRTSVNDEVLTESMLTVDHEENRKLMKKLKWITNIGFCCLIIGLLLFLALPLIIHSMAVNGAIEQAIISKDK